MCSHYQTVKDQKRIEKYFRARGITTPNFDICPDKPGLFIRRPLEWESDDDAIPEREVVIGRWGLISRMTKADGLASAQKRSTFNARAETAKTPWTFRHAWSKGQRCIIPAEAVFEPDWRSRSEEHTSELQSLMRISYAVFCLKNKT